MKRKIFVLVLIITLALTLGCSDKNVGLEENNSQNPEVSSSEPTSIVSSDNSNKKDQTSKILPLSDAEKDIYNEFAQSKSDKELENLAPIEVCKLYFYANEINDFETQYALYYSDENVPSLNQFLSDVESDLVSKDNGIIFNDKLKNELKTIETRELDETTALIEMGFSDEEVIGFRAKKNDNGVWKVSWMPIQ